MLDEAVSILEKEVNEACSSNDAGTSSSSASPLKKSSTFTDSMASELLAASMSPSYDMAFTSASARRSQSQLSSSGYSRNNSLPHIAFNQLKMESIKPFTGSTGDHLNLLDLFNLLRKVDGAMLAQFQSPSPIWQLLSQVLDAIQKSREPDAVIVFQSLVESFLLCHHSHCAMSGGTGDDPQSSSSSSSAAATAAASSSSGLSLQTVKSDSLSHLNSSLVVDSFMSSPPASASSDTGKQSSPFVEFVEKHKKVLNHILRRRTACALDQSNFSSLLKYPKLLDFDIKRRYFQAKIAQLRNDGDSRYEEELVQVSRARLFEDSYGRLHRKSADEWKQRFCIKFANEEGQDGGGLLREWYLKMSHEIFNPNYALFRVSPDGVTYTINPASYVNNNHLSYFKFVGRFIAKAIFDNKLLTCYFTRAFYKHILGIAIRYTDLEKEDYQFFRGLEFLLKNDVSTMFLDQTFSIQISEFGQTETRDLLPNGSQIIVAEDNKADYVRLVCQEKMTGAIRQQLHSFLEGFYEIIPKNLIAIFNEKELELLICGLPEIDLNDLKVNTVYNKYTPASPQVLIDSSLCVCVLCALCVMQR